MSAPDLTRMGTPEAADNGAWDLQDHATRKDRIPERRASESRRILLLFPTLAAVLAIWLLAMNAARLVEVIAERDEARAEVQRLKNLPPQKVCKHGRNGLVTCVEIHRGV